MAVRSDPRGVRIEVWVQPRASRTAVVGIQGDALKIRVAAPPVEGAANAELARCLSKVLGVARGDVEIVRGHGSRRKTVLVRGLDEARAREALGLG